MSHADLLSEFQRLGLNEDRGMRLLYSASPTVISDESIRWMDIADADFIALLEWITTRTHEA